MNPSGRGTFESHKTRRVACVTSLAALLSFGIALPVLVTNQQAVAQNATTTPTTPTTPTPSSKPSSIAETVSEPLVSFSGSNSRIVKPSFQRITSAKDWEALWKRHTGLPSSEYYDRSSLPRINFDECMVIAIFSGSSTANDGVSALSVTEQPGRLVFSYANRYLQVYVPHPKAKVTPRGAFGMFVLPRSSKPVVVGEYVRDRKGAMPIFKERIQLL